MTVKQEPAVDDGKRKPPAHDAVATDCPQARTCSGIRSPSRVGTFHTSRA